MTQVRFVVESLSQFLNQNEKEKIEDEWSRYRVDNSVMDEWISKVLDNSDIVYERIDDYWTKVLKIRDGTGRLKYPYLAKLVKAALSLPHENADVERVFSSNNNLITADRNALAVETIRSCRWIKDLIL